MVVVVIGLLVVIWNYDLHNIVSTKVRVDNAGDAAALSAARWQGITLNMIGDLNLMQAAYVCEHLDVPTNETNVAEIQAEIGQMDALRARLSLNGPLMGFVAAQSAAFMNLNEKDEQNREDDFSAWIIKRSVDFQTCGAFYEGVVMEPYDNAWAEYGNMLASIGHNEMVVDCANPSFFLYYAGSHMLLTSEFYAAVAGKYWCHFARGSRRNLINGYNGYTDWPALPRLAHRPSVNSEYFGLELGMVEVELNLVADIYAAPMVSNYYDHLDFDDWPLSDQMERLFQGELTTNYTVNNMNRLPYAFSIQFPWHLFNMSNWLRKWPTSDSFPFEPGMRVRDEYNYRGANAAVDCYIHSANITPNMTIATDWIYWRAAAKPFGYLQDPDQTEVRRPPVYFGVVLPAFHEVRLIHTSLSSSPKGVAYPGAFEHAYEHLPLYMSQGLPGIESFTGCWYCDQLRRWENEAFRQEGLDWLETNQDGIDNETICTPPPPGYDDGGGGGRSMGRG